MLANVGGSTLAFVDVGGKFGRDLAARGQGAMTAFATEWLTGLYGTDIGKAVGKTHATQWNDAPFALGAFSAAAVGGQPSRRILMEPLRERVFFAGEAVHETLWGTVGGAWESGERAADGGVADVRHRQPKPRAAAQRRRRQAAAAAAAMMQRPKALIAWSSGKDSAWALHEVRRAGDYDIVAALTTVTDTFARVSMHGVREELLRAQLDAAGLAVDRSCASRFLARTTSTSAKWPAALAQAKADGVTHVIFGDLFLADLRAYREAKLAQIGHDRGVSALAAPDRQRLRRR